ncbi:GNAT family N-acetyltransferase [Candidatus Omnitrophota bacterium]
MKPSELVTVAEVLAAAYAEDPVHIWAMPKSATRLADATEFFVFFLRSMQRYRWEVFATADRGAVAVMASVGQFNREYRDGVRYMPTLIRAVSPAAEFFQWVETFRPKTDHWYLEFIGCLPTYRSRGLGSLLLREILAKADREGVLTWSWSSNPRNLNFYRRLGFEVGSEIRRDANTPTVIPIWRQPVPLGQLPIDAEDEKGGS